jgi:glucans biosynthesis protein
MTFPVQKIHATACSVAVIVATFGLSACGDTPDPGAVAAEGASPGAVAAAPDLPLDRGSVAALGALPAGAERIAALVDSVVERARERARRPWIAPDSSLSAPAAALTYGQYRDIRFREEATIWRDSSDFRVQLFHPGAGFRVPVAVSLVEPEGAAPLPFDADRFSYGALLDERPLELDPAAGHAGFRVLYPLNSEDRWDEVLAVLGASYFRLLGPGQVYGLSARALAVGVAGPDGEEFPDFIAGWLVRPQPGDSVLHWVALLDSPSVTGAWHFTLRPGRPSVEPAGPLPEPIQGPSPGPHPGQPSLPPSSAPTVLDVDARIFARRDLPLLGLAPLTSMYLHGTFRPGGPRGDDVRPRVHDSEGLLMRTAAGEWIWRPLTNRTRVSVTTLSDTLVSGFGLVQRARDFDDYLDLEAQYHRRPSLWVEALDGDWGAGGVQLVELPSPSEFNDNIVAYWTPAGGFAAGEERRLRYRLTTFDAPAPPEVAQRSTQRLAGNTAPPSTGIEGADAAPRAGASGATGALRGEQQAATRVARVRRTRVGWDALPGQADPPPLSRRRAVVDFAPSVMGSMAAGEPLPEARLEVWGGRTDDVRVLRLPDGGVRVTFAFEPDLPDRGAEDRDANDVNPATDAFVDLRLWLDREGQRVSETWSWLWRADDDI